MNQPDFTVVVKGLPAPQGSKRYVGNGRMIESSKRVAPWRQAVTDAIGIGATALDGPLFVHVVFTVAKPKSASKTRVTYPITRSSGDIDKLQRSTFDALGDSGIIRDDSQITRVSVSKVFPNEGEGSLNEPGAVIRIWKLDH